MLVILGEDGDIADIDEIFIALAGSRPQCQDQTQEEKEKSLHRY
jgi:hypothetical protein